MERWLRKVGRELGLEMEGLGEEMAEKGRKGDKLTKLGGREGEMAKNG